VVSSNVNGASLLGYDGNDLLFSNASNETLIGGLGDDLLVGGGGNDTYNIGLGDGNDTIFDVLGKSSAYQGDTIRFTATGNEILTALNFERVGTDLVITYNDQTITVHQHYVGTRDIEQVTFDGFASVLGYTLSTYSLTTGLTGHAIGGVRSIVASTSAGETLTGGASSALLFGNGGNDTLNGSAAADFLSGGTGNDVLSGGTDNDTLVGGADADTLTGGLGNDRFVFIAASESTLAATDTITDFTAGGTDDVIDLDAFDFTGAAAAAIKQTSPGTFTSADAADFFDGAGTDLAVVVEYFGGNAQVYVDANKDGNFTAADDLVVRLNAISPNSLTVNDFLFI
jgi:Ca2+-binding RTX toxin-like protein